jgi:cell division protein FtsB
MSSSSLVNIKPRVSAYKGNSSGSAVMMKDIHDASPPQFDTYDNDYDNDDNEKHSKIQRMSRQYLIKSIVGLLFFFVVALSLQSYLEQETMVVKQQQQQQTQQQAQQPQQAAAAPVRKTSTTSQQQDDDDDDYLEQDTRLATIVKELDRQVRARKATKGVIMETDPQGLSLTKRLQEATLQLLRHRYQSMGPFRIRVDITYPDSILLLLQNTNNVKQQHDFFVIETAPASLLPCSVFYFLEMARTYQSGSFHRNAPHVLQAQVRSQATRDHKSMPFQEYSDQFPHAQYTTGYAGRPSGPGWYVSIQDNTHNHGPGTQQDHNPYEADSLFGKLVVSSSSSSVVKAVDTDNADYVKVMNTIHSVPQKGWLDQANEIPITKLTIFHPIKINDNDEQWVPLTFPTFNNEDLMLTMQ